MQRDGKPIQHGYSAYKRHMCRCDTCREANTAYEAARRRKVRLITKPRPMFSGDTFTREELLRFRKESDGR